jgi:type IV pilus assembly protein PilC
MAVNMQGLGDLKKDEGPKVKTSFIEKLNSGFAKLLGVPLKEKLFFLQHLSVMLKAGISLSASLKTLSAQTENKHFKTILLDISSKVEKGVSFTESLREHERIFGELFINMVEAGELSGKLEQVLERLFIQTKKSYELRSKVKGALTYPLVILIAMLGIGSFMMFFIIPKITAMFKEFNAKLPLPTRILIGISEAVVNNGVLSAVIFLISIGVIVQVLRTRRGKSIFQTILLKTPIISGIIKKINIAQFARTISSLLKTDIMIIKTFQITGNTMGNLLYRKALMDMSDRIKKGGKISDVVASYPKLFPPIVVQMVSVGEETGELDNILEQLAEFYESEIDQIMENLPSIIEPILILLMGCGVGGIAVAILVPMFTITSAI